MGVKISKNSEVSKSGKKYILFDNNINYRKTLENLRPAQLVDIKSDMS